MSTGFAFNFLSDSTDNVPQPNTPVEKIAQGERTNDSSSDPPRPLRLPFAWVDNLGPLLKERAQEELVYTDIPVVARTDEARGTSGDVSCQPMRSVDLGSSSFCFGKSEHDKDPDNNEGGHDDDESVWRTTDIQTGIYEGGRKVWECSRDLVEYMAQEGIQLLKKDRTDGEQRSVYCLEIGCGHGLPGCFLLREALQMDPMNSGEFVVVLTDYNRSVVLDATISNLVLNCTSQNDEPPVKEGGGLGDPSFVITAALDNLLKHVCVGAGDWLGMSKQLLGRGKARQRSDNNDLLPSDGMFDIILAAETIYTESAARETALLLRRHLRPGTGVAYVATKRYYFGVGGGMDPFRNFASDESNGATRMTIETVRVHDSGTSNIREVLKVQCVPRFA